jgi:hypothetical protein
MSNGDVYQGFFKNGMKNGKGILKLESEKKIFEGIWQNDIFLDKLIL